MNRHYYISDNLDDLEALETELEANGINTEQIHVLSEQVADVEEHHLHEVNSLMKQDVVHSGEIGAVVGVPLAALILGGAYWLGWTETAAGWVPLSSLPLLYLASASGKAAFLVFRYLTRTSATLNRWWKTANISSSWMLIRIRSRYWIGSLNIIQN